MGLVTKKGLALRDAHCVICAQEGEARPFPLVKRAVAGQGAFLEIPQEVESGLHYFVL